MGTFSTNGIDLSEPILDTMTAGIWLLCMQALCWTWNPSCLQPGTHLGGPVVEE